MAESTASELYSFVNSISSYSYPLNRMVSNSQAVVDYCVAHGSSDIVNSSDLFSTQIRTYKLLSNSNSAVHTASESYYSIVFMLLNLLNPQKFILQDTAHTMYEIYDKFSDRNIHFVNSPDLHFLESAVGKDLSSCSLIRRSDIENGTFDNDFDLAWIAMNVSSYDYNTVRTFYDHLAPGGHLILIDSQHYSGFLHEHSCEHSYYPFYSGILEWPNASVFHIIQSFGICFIKKEA